MKGRSKFLVLIGIVILGIVIAFSFNPSDQKSARDTRTVEWRHVHGIGVDPTDSSILYIATHGDFYQSKSGDIPIKVDKVRADYMAFNAPHDKDSPLYASGHPSSGGNTGLIKSTDGGITWQSVAKVLEPAVDFHAMALSKSDPNLILGFDSGGRGLFKTIDAGKTWEKLEYPEYIAALAISSNDSQLIFVGTGNGIFKSNDGGTTWTHIAYKGLPVSALNFDDGNILFASIDTFGLVRSDDLGATWEDLPELEMMHGIARFTKTPSRVIVRSTLSKAGHRYFSFITETGAKKILAYLNQRMIEGEVLGPESSVIAPFSKYKRFRGKNEGRKFVCTAIIERDVRVTMRPRFKWRPYVLRAFFDTQLLIAESRGKIAHDFRVFFMGHTGSIEAKYTTNKSILSKMLTDEMYESFKKCQEFLDYEINSHKDEEIANQRVVSPEEFEKLVLEGWQFLGTLPSGKIVIKNGRT